MQSPFNEAYNYQIINESLKTIVASPKVLLATAVLLGIIDVGYVIPKISELRQKVETTLQQKEPEQVKQIEIKAVQNQNASKVLQLYNKIKDSWKNYKPVPPSAALKQQSNDQISQDFLIKAKNMLKQDEGKKASLYKDTKKKWTIGYGHLIKSAAELKKYQNQTLTDQQINQLLDVDVNSKIQTAQRLFPKFNQYNDEFKMTLLNGIFRGDISGSPKTIELINNSKYNQAAKEYLKHGDYIAASKPGAPDSGVAIRMLRNAKIITKQTDK